MKHSASVLCVLLIFFSACKKGDTGTSSNSSTLGEGPVAYYPFDGNADDASGYGNPGIMNDVVPTTSRLGVESGALTFNGTSSSVTFPSSSVLNQLTNDLTLALWVRTVPFSAPGYQAGVLLSKRDYTVAGYPIHFLLQYDISCLEFFAQMSSDPYEQYRSFFDTYHTLADSTWHFVVVTHSYSDTSKTKMYIDCVNQPGYWSCATDSVQGPAKVGASQLIVGKQSIPGGEYPFKGSLDDIRIYNRILSAEEIGALYVSRN